MQLNRCIALGLISCCLLSAFCRHACAESKRRPAWTTSKLKGAPVPPARYKLVPAFPEVRFDLPTCIEAVPGTQRVLVTERGGKIFTCEKESRGRDLVIDLATGGKPVSVLDAEFDPRFDRNRRLYVSYVHPGDGNRHTRVSRFQLKDESSLKAIPDSEQVIITWPSGGHNGGCLEFGKDGYLYISTGDGSGPNPPDGLTTGQKISDLLGAVLRIDVGRKAADNHYTVPSDNPFVNRSNARPEVWAYGLRNPWKFGVDPKSGDIFAADNGWEAWEMVHQIVRGGNCGWPVMEGRAVLRSEVEPGPTPIRPPVKDHPHTEANSVIGGPVYRGEKLKDLDGAFIYGDYITGTIWSLKSTGDGNHTHETLVDTDQRIVSFTQGSHGELYVLDFDFTGQIYELLPSDVKDTSAEFPRRLSETGVFSSVRTLEPSAGVVPYDVRVSPWTDGANAQRWIAIPDRQTVAVSKKATVSSRFPDGTVLVKHLELPRKECSATRLETQILLQQNGRWNPYSYLWNDNGTDATLVDSIGVDHPLQLEGEPDRTWHVSAVNECKLCHNAGSHFVLGFSLNQLDVKQNGGSQLESLADLGVIEPPALPIDSATRLVNPHDASQPLDDRARSYLHANCAMCHHPGGNAIVSFYLRRDLPFEKLNTNKGTGIGTFGLHDAKLITPGDPYRSVLMYRMSKLGYARMPYIGSRVVDSRGVSLIDQWIRSLPGDGTAKSSPLTDGSADAKALARLITTEARRPRTADVKQLLNSSGGALALASQIHQGHISDADRDFTLKQIQSARSDIAGLFETFLPESERRARLGPNIQPQTILAKTGDATRGKLIFFSDNARCRNCHRADDATESLGPTLADIRKKYPRRSEMLQHVLQPSRKIDEKFVGYSVLLNSGRVETGLLISQSPQEVVLRSTQKKTLRIPRTEIATLKKNTKSLMPDRLLSDLTAQEAADLLSFFMQQ